jgi:hypothetical protein
VDERRAWRAAPDSGPHKGHIVGFMADRNASRAQRLQRQMNSHAEGPELFASKDPRHTFLKRPAYAAGKHAEPLAAWLRPAAIGIGMTTAPPPYGSLHGGAVDCSGGHRAFKAGFRRAEECLQPRATSPYCRSQIRAMLRGPPCARTPVSHVGGINIVPAIDG